MSTPFLARTGRVSRSLEKAFGEEFTFTARATANGDVNLPMVADGSKPSFTCRGCYENVAQSEHPLARGSAPDDNTVGRSAGYPSVRVDNALLLWMPTRGALCTRVLDGTVYEVSRPLPNEKANSTTFILTAKRKP